MQIAPRPTIIDKEVLWDKKNVIMSKSDLYGNIEYTNDAFMDASGYEEHEVMSKPHNILRHPDMPKVIFKLLWKSLKDGENFHAIVKNLAKSGRYYWVVTDFEIIKDSDGEITGYIGRRKAVSADVIAKIEPLYQKILNIEQVSGVEASEKYLVGFLEEKRKNYVEYIKDTVGGKSFFGKLFGRK